MNIFEYLDLLLFGPTVRFAVVTRYSLDDSVARLRARLIPRWNILRRFRPGLCGSVDSTNVRIAWHDPIARGISQPTFVGVFDRDKNHVVLSGTIGVPFSQKIVSMLMVAAFVVVDVIIVGGASFREVDAPFRVVPIALPLIGLALFIVVSALKRRDVQRIADALDAALT